MSRARRIGFALAAIALVWFLMVFFTAGHVRAGVGGHDRVVVPSVQHEQQLRALVRLAGGLLVIVAGVIVAETRARARARERT